VFRELAASSFRADHAAQLADVCPLCARSRLSSTDRRDLYVALCKAETLEDYFEPARLKSDYVPKDFHIGPGPIQGHQFGLDLPSADKQDLIAFLKTL
jgi:hypothetical protein